MNGTRRSSGGFTLIELLVVIAIIAILAAILFPVFARAQDQAKLARCICELKQVGVAFSLYLDDYNGLLPVPRITDMNGVIMSDRTWPEGQCMGGQAGKLDNNRPYSPPFARPLNKYVKSVESFHCPSEKKQDCAGLKNEFPWKRFGSSYNMNVTFHYPTDRDFFYTLVKPTGSREPAAMFMGRAISEIRKTKRMILAGERPIHHWYGVSGAIKEPEPLGEKPFLGHGGTEPWTPVLFADLHVGYVLMTPGLSGRGWALAQKGWCPGAPNEGD